MNFAAFGCEFSKVHPCPLVLGGIQRNVLTPDSPRHPTPRQTATCVFDGPINGECFHTYVRQQLIPTLKAGDVVILDNLGSHKAKAISDAIRDVGARLWFLPKYPPDLNPIEQAFAKIKHWMRQAQKRTIEETWPYLGLLADTIKPEECANYFSNAGYASVKT